MGIMANLQNIIDRLAGGQLDIDAAVGEVRDMPDAPIRFAKGPRESLQDILADPDGGVRADELGVILAAAFNADKIDKEQYRALAAAL